MATTSAQYQRQKERAKARSRKMAAAGQDIGAIPPVKDHARKEQARRSFKAFCESYLPHIFYHPWSKDQLVAIDRIERAVLRGGTFALAMPRGSGKTMLCLAAALWAAFIGAHPYTMLIAATEPKAADLLETIKAELTKPGPMADDWPEIVYPLQALENEARRCKGQTHHGRKTAVEWSQSQIRLPTIAGSAASGAIIQAAGLTGSELRGANQGGVRPTLAICDDPQTDESARSYTQNRHRLRLITGTVLGMAAPGRKLAVLTPCTVIAPGDLSDQLLDRDKHPEWQGHRTKLVYAWPARQDLWDEYAKIRKEAMQGGDQEATAATEFYRQHQAEMDEGAEVSWPARFNHDEISAIQHAVNLRLKDAAAFDAEYQNDPQPEDAGTQTLTEAMVLERINGLPRGIVPIAATKLVAFIDVQETLLYYAVTAWAPDFTGSIVEYGTWPDQRRQWYTLSEARPTIQQVTGIQTLEAAILKALAELEEYLLGREWKTERGNPVKIDRLGIDANYGQLTGTVYTWARRSQHSAIIFPCHGIGIGPSNRPMNSDATKPGDQIGPDWKIPGDPGKHAKRHLSYDTNAWKSRTSGRLAAPVGTPGGLSIYGDAKTPPHELLAYHLTAEFSVPTQGRGRQVNVWKQRPDRPDNHFFDCTVGSTVLASTLGIADTPDSQPKQSGRTPKRIRRAG